MSRDSWKPRRRRGNARRGQVPPRRAGAPFESRFRRSRRSQEEARRTQRQSRRREEVAAEKASSGSHAVCTAYHGLRSLKLPTAALQVVESTLRRGFKSYSARHIFSRACRGINAESPTHNLTHNPPACIRG